MLLTTFSSIDMLLVDTSSFVGLPQPLPSHIKSVVWIKLQSDIISFNKGLLGLPCTKVIPFLYSSNKEIDLANTGTISIFSKETVNFSTNLTKQLLTLIGILIIIIIITHRKTK